MTLENLKDLATIVGVIITAGIAAWAVFVFWNNSRLERAKWLERLYEKFYENERYKEIRNLIDSDDRKAVSSMVEVESSEFTDYLNFFEFVSILESNRQLDIGEVKDMFAYYLNSLKDDPDTSKYVRDSTKGFEKLAALFDKI